MMCASTRLLRCGDELGPRAFYQHRHARCQHGGENFSDHDYADNVALLTELMELLLSALKIFAVKAAPIGMVVSWKKTKMQSLSNFLPPTGDLDIGGEQVETITSFTYLGATTHSSCRSGQEISMQLGIARSSFRYMALMCRSRLTLHIKVRLYNASCPSLSTLETRTMTQADNNRLDALTNGV